jgi:hypothetical protein
MIIRINSFDRKTETVEYDSDEEEDVNYTVELFKGTVVMRVILLLQIGWMVILYILLKIFC